MKKNYDFSKGIRNKKPIENKGEFTVRIHYDVSGGTPNRKIEKKSYEPINDREHAHA